MQEYNGENFYLNKIEELPHLKNKQQLSLVNKAKKGNQEARDILINSSLITLERIANYYAERELGDLISEGSLGIIEAISHFDRTKGKYFDGYLGYWIKKFIRNFDKTNMNIKIPLKSKEIYEQLNKVKSDIEETTGREATDEELEERTGYSDKTIRNYRRYNLSQITEEISREDESTSRYGIYLGYDNLEIEDMISNALSALEKLSPLEREIIESRFGLARKQEMKLEEIAKKIRDKKEVVPERIRQIEQRALKKIKEYLVYSKQPTIKKKVYSEKERKNRIIKPKITPLYLLFMKSA